MSKEEAWFWPKDNNKKSPGSGKPWAWPGYDKSPSTIEYVPKPRRASKSGFPIILLAVAVALVVIFILIGLTSGSNPVSASIQANSSVSEHVLSSWDSLRDNCSNAIDRLSSSIDDLVGKR
jgi:hypothetical protein